MAPGLLPAQLVRAPRYGSNVDNPAPQLNLPPLPPALTPHGTVVEDIVVRVDDQIISRSDVARAEQQMQEEAAQSNVPAAELAQRQRDMLRDMIDQQLLLARAKELGLNADADVIRQLDEIRKQNKMDSLDDLEKAARQQGVNFEDFKAKIRNQILAQQVVRDEVGRRLQMTEAEEKRYYEEHLKDFDQPEQIRLSEILVPLPETASPAEIEQGQTKANGIKTQVMQGADFAALAKKVSGGPSAAQGGELGLFKRGALAPVLEEQTFNLKPGESTQPIRTRQGFVILKVEDHIAVGPAPMKSVEPQIQEAMYVAQMQPAMRAYLSKLREQSYVDVQPGFVDSGSTGGETKPVFTAYAPPVVKKKVVAKNKPRFVRAGVTSTAALSKPVVASPDTTGTRTITGPDAKPAIDPTTGLANIAPPKTTTTANGKKVAKVKREKVRFGQAPTHALPGDSSEATTTTDGGVVATGAAKSRLGRHRNRCRSSAGGDGQSERQPADPSRSGARENPLRCEGGGGQRKEGEDGQRQAGGEGGGDPNANYGRGKGGAADPGSSARRRGRGYFQEAKEAEAGEGRPEGAAGEQACGCSGGSPDRRTNGESGTGAHSGHAAEHKGVRSSRNDPSPAATLAVGKLREHESLLCSGRAAF